MITVSYVTWNVDCGANLTALTVWEMTKADAAAAAAVDDDDNYQATNFWKGPHKIFFLIF